MNRKVFFLHIPKCAGQSIAHALESEVEDKTRILAIWDSNLGAEMGPEGFQAADLAQLSLYECIWGHLPFPCFRDKLGHGHVRDRYYVFTNIREPLDRAVSEYLYIRRTQIHPQHEFCATHSFAEFLREEFRDNIQCEYVCGKADFPAAKQELDTFFDTCGPFEDLPRLWSKVATDLGLSGALCLPVLNKAESEERPALSGDEISAFYHRNIPDLRLFWWVREEWERAQQPSASRV